MHYGMIRNFPHAEFEINYYRAGGTFFKVGGHSGGIFFGGGSAISFARERSDRGAGASIHFSDLGGGAKVIKM